MKRLIVLVIVLLGLVAALCFIKLGGKECTMIVRISGDGFDESGGALGSIEKEKTFTVKKGQKVYGSSSGGIYIDRDDSDDMLFRIVDIDDEGVTIKYRSSKDSYSKNKMDYGSLKTMKPQHTVHDGRNYVFRIKFEKTE